uniref:Uncharacterized protein n=1 Tax=mine drainage metagenome TaxID=410659 RepID=E6QE01_9ZZZZ
MCQQNPQVRQHHGTGSMGTADTKSKAERAEYPLPVLRHRRIGKNLRPADAA